MSRSLAEIVATSPNAPVPAIVKGLLESYLYGYWQQGALQGATTNQAYFVDCTIAPSALSCAVGVSTIKPAEFEVFQLSISYGDVIFASGFEANELVRTGIQETVVTACVPHLRC